MLKIFIRKHSKYVLIKQGAVRARKFIGCECSD